MTERDKKIFRVTIVGSIVNFLLVAFKFMAGILGNSAAMVADAVHSLSDFLTDIVVLVFVKVSGKPEDATHNYGHGKYETLATVIIGAALLVVGLGIFYNGMTGVVACFKGNPPAAPGMLAFVAAVLSMVSKEIVYQYTVRTGKALNSHALVANAWHHRSDALSSIGTLLGIGGAIFLGEKWTVLDSLAAVIVSVFIVKVAIQIAKPGIDELLEKSLPKEVEDRILKIILSFPGVNAPHQLRTRRIGNNYAIEVCIRINGDCTLREAHSLADGIEKRLKTEFGQNTHVGIHMEPMMSDDARCCVCGDKSK